jgi:hypothetical protein
MSNGFIDLFCIIMCIVGVPIVVFLTRKDDDEDTEEGAGCIAIGICIIVTIIVARSCS